MTAGQHRLTGIKSKPCLLCRRPVATDTMLTKQRLDPGLIEGFLLGAVSFPALFFWPSVFWPSVFWPRVFWPSVFWPSVFWTSVFWTSIFWTSVFPVCWTEFLVGCGLWVRPRRG